MIEENHNLIYSYLHKKGYNVDDYYGLLAETMCKAIKKYNKDMPISVYLYKCFDNAIINDWKKNSKIQYCELVDNATAGYSNEDGWVNKIIMEKFSNDKILKLYLQGYTLREIADKVGLAHSSVSRHIAKVKLSLEKILKEE